MLYEKTNSPSLLIPPPLAPGGTIGVIAPSGIPKDAEHFYKGVQLLKEKGYRVKFPRELWPGHNYLANTDHARAEEFHRMMADSEVDALFCLRGGYGILRLLPLLDFAELRKHPKYIVGFSDISLLQNVLLDKIGLPSIHGPVMTSLDSGSTSAFTSIEALLHGHTELMFSQDRPELLHGDADVQGQLIGGNLTSLLSVLGTEFDFSWENKIVFLEDIGEPLYKIDRMLTQLQLAGKFNGVQAILLGDFTHKSGGLHAERENYLESVWQRVVDMVYDKNIPVLGNIASGHISENHALLLGSHISLTRRETRIHVKPLGKEG